MAWMSCISDSCLTHMFSFLLPHFNLDFFKLFCLLLFVLFLFSCLPLYYPHHYRLTVNRGGKLSNKTADKMAPMGSVPSR